MLISNVTESKEGTISLRSFGLGFLIDGKPSRKDRKQQRQLEAEGEEPGAVSKRKWWGLRRRKIKKHASNTTHQAGISEKEQQPQPIRAQTEYDEPHRVTEDGFTYGGKGSPSWKARSWEDLKVGDFVKLTNNEAVPAGAPIMLSHDYCNGLIKDIDIVICSTSEEENVVYIETKNLDGETNLKSRTAIPELTDLRTAAECTHAKFVAEADSPSVDMFKYNASIAFGDGRKDAWGKDLRLPVTLNNMLLRGTVVRNTEWAIGFVLATGVDTKIVLNSGGTPSKRSKVERQMNPQVYVKFLSI